jgi:hypothetical protein
VKNLISIFLSRMGDFVIWLGDFVEDSRTGRPSVKRFGLALAVTILCAVMGALGGVAAGVTWNLQDTEKSVELVRELLSALTWLAGLVLSAVTTGYLVDKNQARKSASKQEESAP